MSEKSEQYYVASFKDQKAGLTATKITANRVLIIHLNCTDFMKIAYSI